MFIDQEELDMPRVGNIFQIQDNTVKYRCIDSVVVIEEDRGFCVCSGRKGEYHASRNGLLGHHFDLKDGQYGFLHNLSVKTALLFEHPYMPFWSIEKYIGQERPIDDYTRSGYESYRRLTDNYSLPSLEAPELIIDDYDWLRQGFYIARQKMSKSRPVYIRYVHELQNLFFRVVKKELIPDSIQILKYVRNNNLVTTKSY
jgi:hypothetical protein